VSSSPLSLCNGACDALRDLEADSRPVLGRYFFSARSISSPNGSPPALTAALSSGTAVSAAPEEMLMTRRETPVSVKTRQKRFTVHRRHHPVRRGLGREGAVPRPGTGDGRGDGPRLSRRGRAPRSALAPFDARSPSARHTTRDCGLPPTARRPRLATRGGAPRPARVAASGG
jgi:hypothetical protein